MSERKSAEVRKQEMITALNELHAKSKTQADFTPEAAAAALGVSVVWLYNRVGKEFRELRSTLPGPRKNREFTVERLKDQIRRLQEENRELKEKLKGAAFQEVAEAVAMIESLDEDNRRLREENKLLRERLSESEIIFIPNYVSSSYKIKRRNII